MSGCYETEIAFNKHEDGAQRVLPLHQRINLNFIY